MVDDNLVEMAIQGIAYNSGTGTPVLLLQSKTDNLILPLEVGPFEANAILVSLKGIQTPRMLTHDLFAFFMRRHGYRVEHLLIYGRNENRYQAKLQYRKRRKTEMLDVRPSDGIALAIQFKAPIYSYNYLVVSQPENLYPYSDPDHLPPESLYINAEDGDHHFM